ncbi:MAG: YggT family protein [Chloroflexi bacterium]|nr:YggT family protein [Chloroflexota bacterium]
MAFIIIFINLFFQILSWAIIIRILLSWVRIDPYHPLIRLLDQITEPILAPIRNILPSAGGFDFSPIVAIVLLSLLQRLVLSLF